MQYCCCTWRITKKFQSKQVNWASRSFFSTKEEISHSKNTLSVNINYLPSQHSVVLDDKTELSVRACSNWPRNHLSLAVVSSFKRFCHLLLQSALASVQRRLLVTKLTQALETGIFIQSTVNTSWEVKELSKWISVYT